MSWWVGGLRVHFPPCLLWLHTGKILNKPKSIDKKSHENCRPFIGHKSHESGERRLFSVSFSIIQHYAEKTQHCGQCSLHLCQIKFISPKDHTTVLWYRDQLFREVLVWLFWWVWLLRSHWFKQTAFASWVQLGWPKRFQYENVQKIEQCFNLDSWTHEVTMIEGDGCRLVRYDSNNLRGAVWGEPWIHLICIKTSRVWAF